MIKYFLMNCLICIGLSAFANERVYTGIEVLRERNFDILAGKRVGLLTNPSGTDYDLRSTADILYEAKNVNLVALFAPEHGIRGDIYAGFKVEDGKDKKTGLPVYSLYGNTREPSAKMLENIDVIVYDIQDVGVRSYTFISTLGLMMRACAQKNIEVVVLDRPNPLGGNKIEGKIVEDGFFSFVGQYKIPYIYGLTVGELALLINEEGMNCGQKGQFPHLKCKLTVVPMRNWTRNMLYEDTKLPWVLPSPNIPSTDAVKGYPSSGICGELYNYLNIGIGYTLPFQTFAAEWIDADKLKAELDSYSIPGVAFRTIHYKPFSGSGKDKLLHGVQFFFTSYEEARMTLIQFYVIQAVNKLYPERNPFKKSSERFAMIDKICGTDKLRILFSQNLMVGDIYELWTMDEEPFRKLSEKYYMYP